ncbi:hypothetical protein [Paenibacillus sp. IHBB 10380]|uniref:hypothetical protein n=1 Tax=Paenibacillus sp. IHBB 10380 TaxID=1566358 RepID=UPI000A6FF515|nr:hypothetical protein [Paenibacillus sp. IHBB 10380]
MSKRNNINKLNIEDLDLSASDLALIASILTILGDTFALLAVLKTKEEEAAAKKKA